VRIAAEIDRPAYDCFYLALAVATECRFVTAGRRAIAGRNARPRRRVCNPSPTHALMAR